MKRFGCLVLAIIMLGLLFAGCEPSSGPSGIAPTEGQTVAQNPSGVADFVENALGVDIDEKTLAVESVQTIDGQTVAHCTQNYQGVEILGGAMVAIGGTDAQVIGTYYDLSEAFGDDFADQVQEASQVPDWMEEEYVDDVKVQYHTDTMKPVIYMDGETPILARQFELTLSDENSAMRYTMVTDLDGQVCYEYQSPYMGFTSTQTQDGTFVAEQDGKYYAYDMEHSVYISNISVMDQDILDKYYDGNGALLEDYLVHELTGGKEDELPLALLGAMGDVMQWYEDQFGYRGVNGSGGEAMCIVVAEHKLGSIAANACENGHIFLLAFNERMESIANAPEIFAHEMGHAVLKNTAGLHNSNQSGSLHEAISDVFACLYDPDKDWEIGDGLYGVSSRNIAAYKRTMSDFRYDSQYMLDIDTGEQKYIGENNILTYIREKVVGTESCSVATYYNAAIVSGTMHKIWRDVFHKDDELFGKMLMDSLHYLPRNANFSQFRAAFMYVARKMMGEEFARQVGMKFDAAGIRHNAENYKYIHAQEVPNSLIEMLDKTYGEVSVMPWDSCDFAEVEDQWYCFCEKDGYSLNFTYEGSNEADPKALPVSLDLFYYNDQEPIDPVPIAKGLKFGMTYGEIGEKFDISPLENTEYAGSEYPVIARIEAEKYSIVLIFDGVDDDAVFNGVTIMKK